MSEVECDKMLIMYANYNLNPTWMEYTDRKESVITGHEYFIRNENQLEKR